MTSTGKRTRRRAFSMTIGIAVAAVVALSGGAVESASANTWQAWCWGCHFSSGYANRQFSSGHTGLVRTTNYSTGSATAGTGIVDAGTGGEYYTYCSSAGCTADTGDFTCGSWYSGSQAEAWDHSSWADTFNAALYLC